MTDIDEFRPDPTLREAMKIISELTKEICELTSVVGFQQQTIDRLTSPRSASRVVLTVTKGEQPVPPTSISIDDLAGKATLAYQDDKGDAATAPTSPDGSPLHYAWASDNTAVLTVASDPADPSGATADLTPVAEGSANVSVTVTDDTGAGAVFADGQPVAAAPAAVSVVAGPAASLVITTTP